MKKRKTDREFNRKEELVDWDRFWKEKPKEIKLSIACIELVISSWSMWWWWAAISHGYRHIAEPYKSGVDPWVLALLCFLFFFDLVQVLQVAEQAEELTGSTCNDPPRHYDIITLICDNFNFYKKNYLNFAYENRSNFVTTYIHPTTCHYLSEYT